jgi:hypothetical protein
MDPLRYGAGSAVSLRAAAMAGAVALCACTPPPRVAETATAGSAPAAVGSAPASIGSFTLALATPSLRIERTKSATVAITVTRTAPFVGPVSVTIAPAASPGLPPGVLASPLTIAAGQRIGVLTLVASGAARFGPATLVVQGAGAAGAAAASAPLELVVGRASGSFAEASPAPYVSTVPSNVTSHTAAFRVEIAPGTAGMPQARQARFFRGAIPIGNVIDFTLGPVSTLGGAGFCDDLAAGALARGVVLSGPMTGLATQNVFTFVDLTGSASPARQLGADLQASTPTPHVFEPRVFFSPDCTIALVVGVARRGPRKHVLRLVDLATGNRLGGDIGFDSTSFAASVVGVGTTQQLQVTVDGTGPKPQTIAIPLP